MAFGETINIFSPMFRRLTDERQMLIQAAIMRLSTERGTYWNDPEYGYDITEAVNDAFDSARLLALQTDVKAELEKDERIESAIVTVRTEEGNGGTVVYLDIELYPVGEDEPLRFTLSVNDLTLELLLGDA
ncbi:hypothetical protein BE21_57485 [Sorangium cellulosum]|uniref:IraD/Gp25-like domain-containing protein n=1 Tax=Sorangium cellulosum TaxID=56 RepID=A0A150U346_SORCE|nr:hypothetical protein BE21_57485 [Sorangium cellulosum]